MMSGWKYGPVGDLNSANPFEWAQARMPDGWHVEGQVLTRTGSAFTWAYASGWEATATRLPDTIGVDRLAVSAVGYTVDLALANLVRIVREMETRRSSLARVALVTA